jgi:hypothetical protein
MALGSQLQQAVLRRISTGFTSASLAALWN